MPTLGFHIDATTGLFPSIGKLDENFATERTADKMELGEGVEEATSYWSTSSSRTAGGA